MVYNLNPAPAQRKLDGTSGLPLLMWGYSHITEKTGGNPDGEKARSG